jgi:hypothetical protein
MKISKTSICKNVSAAFLALLFASGCHDESPLTSPEKALPEYAAASRGGHPMRNITYDDQLEEIGKTAPGFGGFYYDRGTLVVRLKDRGHQPEARAAMLAFFERTGLPGVAQGQERLTRLASLRIEPATYTFAELRGYFAFIAQSVLGLDGVLFGDINEATNRLLIGVLDDDALKTVQAAVAKLPIPVGVVTYEITGRTGRLDAHLQDSIRPVIAGHKITSQNRNCTIGFNLYHVFAGDTWVVDPEEYLITASHCTPQWGGGPATALTDTIRQGPLTNQKVAVLVADRMYLGSTVFPGCPGNKLCRYSDTAVYRYLPTISWTHGYFPWPDNSTTLNYTTTKVILGDSYAAQGQAVYMLGQASGLEPGTVTLTCTYVGEFNRPPLTGLSNKAILCGNRASYLSQPGDSGAGVVMVLQDGTGRLASVGIHFQNDGIFAYFSGQSQYKTDTSNEIPGNWGTAQARN